MSGLIVPQVPFGLSNEELAEIVAKALKELDWAFNGNISDQNISRIANFLASATEFKHISGIVGMSGFDPGNPEAVRFWSGHADKTLAPFRVLQNGKVYATDGEFTGMIEALSGHIGGFTIEDDRLSSDSGEGIIQGGTIIGAYITTSEDSYPRAEMSNTDKSFKVSKDADTYVLFDTDITGDPGLYFKSPTLEAFISMALSTFLFQSFEGDIKIQANGDLWLTSFGKVKFNNWSNVQNNDTSTTLQQEFDAIEDQLDAKQNTFVGGDIVVIDDEAFLTSTGIGAGDYTKLTINAQGRATAGTTLSSSDIPNLAQSKITNLATDLAAKAPTASPAFTGNPTATTQSPGDNSTKLSTTAYADAIYALVQAKKQVGVAFITTALNAWATLTVNFSFAFASTPVVTPTWIQNQSRVFFAITSASTTSFVLNVFNMDGSGLAGVSWTAEI